MLAKLRSHLAHNVVGYIALFIALGGTSYALAKGSVGSREIKNAAVQGKDVKADTLTGKQVAESTLGTVGSAATAAKAGDADKLDNLDSSFFAPRVLWAVVAADGSLLRGNASYAKQVINTNGNYEVGFDQSVVHCALIATLGRTDDQNVNPDPGEIGTAYRNALPNAVFVKTRDSAGAGPEGAQGVPRSFHLAVFC